MHGGPELPSPDARRRPAAEVFPTADALVRAAAEAFADAALRQVLLGPHRPDDLPAQVIAPRAGRLRWLVDAAAAAELRAE